MKNSLALIIFLFFSLSGYSQDKNIEAINFEKQILKSARRIGDPAVATASIYRIIELEGENSTYKDSLAYIYFAARQYAPCFMMTTEVLKRDPNHENMLEIKGVSLESLGAYTKASETYEQLYAKTKINYHGYTLAKLKYTLKKYDEALNVISGVEKLNDTGKYKITFAINQTHEQEVDLMAAISYLKGIIEIELKSLDKAKISLNKALIIQTDFVLAKEKLESLK